MAPTHTAPLAPAVSTVRRTTCVLDRHFGPFEPLEELAGWMGTDWYNCSACRSTITRDTALARRSAA